MAPRHGETVARVQADFLHNHSISNLNRINSTNRIRVVIGRNARGLQVAGSGHRSLREAIGRGSGRGAEAVPADNGRSTAVPVRVVGDRMAHRRGRA